MMRYPVVFCLAFAAAVFTLQAAENVALNRPYRLSQAPPATSPRADTTGPEPYVPDAFYRGELTDGTRRDAGGSAVISLQIRYEPIVVDIDLGDAVVIDALALAPVVGLREGGTQQVSRIDISVRSPQFPHDAWVQVGQWHPTDEAAAPEPVQVALAPVAATQVRLALHGKAWAGLYLDEIEVYRSDAPAVDLLPVEDVTLEAEGCTATAAMAHDDASGGQAVPLGPGDAPLELRVALPAGTYTLRIRSRALQEDTFSGLVPRAHGRDMRLQAVTNELFTWQRSHFTQPQDGDVTISLSCSEGEGVLVDALRIHRTNLNEPILALKEFPRDTFLVRGQGAACIIAAGDGGRYGDLAEALAGELARRYGIAVPIRDGDTLDEAALRSTHVLALGAAESNRVLLQARPGGWGVVPSPPADGAPQVYVAVDVRGRGTNLVLLGGAEQEQVQASIAAFLGRLRLDPELHLPWTQIPPAPVHDQDAFRERAVASGKLLRQGAIRTILRDAKYYDDAAFSLYMHRYWEYLDSADVLTRASYHGALDMEYHKLLPQFEHRQHNPSFSEAEHLALTHLMWRLNELTAGLFAKWWGLLDARDPDDMDRRIRGRAPAITWNHQTFPALGMLFGADYFGRHYDLQAAHQRRQWVATLMQGQLLAAKPRCDCWGYQDITIAHTAYLASLLGRWDYYEAYPLHQFLRLRYAVHDNLGAGVGFGDVGAYGGPVEGDPRDSMGSLAKVTGGRIDLRRTAPEEIQGLYVHPLEPLWYAAYGAGSQTPLNQTFDKISMRQNHDPQRAYLLLDGISGGNHGHWDGNTILRFTDNGRMWLCEGDYLKGDLKEHNALTLTRDAKTALPDPFVRLQAQYADDDWGLTVTRTTNYAGTDWDRHVLWHRPSDTFLLQDRVIAREAGRIDASVRFRSLGATRLEDRIWQVEQAGGERFYLHAPGSGRLQTGTAPEDASNWKAYAFAAPTPQLLRHRLSRQLDSGESVLVANVFYAAGPDAPPRLQVQALEGVGVVARGDLEVVALAGPDIVTGELTLEAAHAVLSPARYVLVGLRHLDLPAFRLTASAPVTLSINPESGETRVMAEKAATLVAEWGGTRRNYRLTAGDEPLAGLPPELSAALESLRQRLAAQAAAGADAAHAGAEIPETPAENVVVRAEVGLDAAATCLAVAGGSAEGLAWEALVGCEDGTLLALRQDGTTAWQRRFSGAVNALAVGDVDGDGQVEIACAVENSHLYLLDAAGAIRWERFFEAYRAAGGIEGHPRVVMIADFEGDGTAEVAVGCANSTFYVLDAAGELKESDSGPWKVVVQHKACAIGAADMTGDGLLELLCGYTYMGRSMVDFSRAGYNRFSSFSGTHGGSKAITAADFDLDGKSEAVFADVDGKVTVAKPYVKTRGTADILWQTFLGDDAHTQAIAANLSGDARSELILASESGFLALLDAEGDVLWIRYAEDAVSDAALLSGSDRAPVLLRTSRDGTLAAFSGSGDQLAFWRAAGPLEKLGAIRSGQTDLAWILQTRRVVRLELVGTP